MQTSSDGDEDEDEARSRRQRSDVMQLRQWRCEQNVNLQSLDHTFENAMTG